MLLFLVVIVILAPFAVMLYGFRPTLGHYKAAFLVASLLLIMALYATYVARRCTKCRSAWTCRRTGNQRPILKMYLLGEAKSPIREETEYRCRRCDGVEWKVTHDGTYTPSVGYGGP